MKLKSLLFGSAAALMAVTGAQAAEPLEPIAEPVDYVRICDAFGTGFFYIPGTDTCLKIGGYVRTDWVYDHDWDRPVVHADPNVNFFDGSLADGTLFIPVRPAEDRNYNEFGTRARARLTVDSRVQTDIGMIRTFYDLWITLGPLNGRGNPVNDSTGLLLRQAFIQIANDWGTITAGRADSFFEFWESDAFATRGIGEDAPISPVNLLAVTWNLGGGVSATLALEDSATDGDRRQANFGTPTFFPIDTNIDGVADAVAQCGGDVFPGSSLARICPTGVSGLHGGNRAPDVVANLRVDQAWGSAQIMGALHSIRARAFTGPTLVPDNEPDDEFGWAVGAGAGIDIPGTGITFNIQGVYSDGAPGFATDRNAPGILSDGFVVGRFTGVNAAGTCVPTAANPNPCTLIGTDIETTEAWSVKAGIGGNLAPDWQFNLQGTFARVDLPDALGAPVGVDPSGNLLFANGPTAVQSLPQSGGAQFAGPIFTSDYDAWGVSGWVGWTPVRGFITALELAYDKIDFDTGPDMDRWGGVFRVQKTF